MKRLLLFLFAALPLAAQGVRHVQVRVVTFEKAGATTALEAAQPGCDESLYAGLAADAAAGKATRVHDQTMIVRGGQRSKVEALREYPFPTEFQADPNWFLYPDSFTWKNLGHTMEAEVTIGELKPGWPQQPLDVNLGPESGTLLALNPWPVPDFRDAGQMGRVLQPVMGFQRVTTQALTWTGRTLLISVMPSPGAALSDITAPAFCYTFLRAGLDGEKPAPPTSTPPHVLNQRRLHAVTIRLPREDAAALLLSSSGDDAALYARLCSMVTNGGAELHDYNAVLCRGGQRSLAASSAEFHYPDTFSDLIPKSWPVLDTGSRLEVDSGGNYESRDMSAAWNVALSRVRELEMVPYHPSAKHRELHGAQASWMEQQFVTSLTIPASGVRCAAVISTTPATEDETAPDGRTDITYLLQSPPPGTPVEQPPPQFFLQAAIFSLPAEKAAGLKAGDSAAALVTRFLAGEFPCPAHAAITFSGQEPIKVAEHRHVPHPIEFNPSSENEAVSLPGMWDILPCGLELNVEHFNSDAKSITVGGKLEWDTAPVQRIGEPGAKIPEELFDRRCTEQIKLANLRLTRNQPVIADVRASDAREGTPEHGRWHVLVLLAR